MLLQEAARVIDEPWETLEHDGLDHRDRSERQQADHRADLETHRLSVGRPQDVVEKSVLFVPHLVLPLTDAIQSGGDPEEMLQIAERLLLVDVIVTRELEGNLEHALREEHHPRRPVGLLQAAPSWQRLAAV